MATTTTTTAGVVVACVPAVVPMTCLDDFEQYAKTFLAKDTYDFFRTGADNEITLRDNRNAFNRYRIYPRVLRDISGLSTATTILGHPISFPVCIAPAAFQKMAHPDGEVASARAARDAGVIYTLSSLSTSSIEELSAGVHAAARSTPPPLLFFQLYVFRDRNFTRQLIKRAEKAGHVAIVLTVDVPLSGKRRDDLRNNFTLPPHLKRANVDDSLDVNATNVSSYVNAMFDASLTWNDVDWIRSITKLPVIVKGLLTAEDASEALQHGVSGIIVSNHGGRQLDSVPAAIDAVADVVKAVNGRCEVFVDGGVRTGTDVFKALALGARAVFIGRPVVYGLAFNGENGVAKVLQILKEEFTSTMALAGCARVSDINRTYLVHYPSVPGSKI